MCEKAFPEELKLL